MSDVQNMGDNVAPMFCHYMFYPTIPITCTVETSCRCLLYYADEKIFKTLVTLTSLDQSATYPVSL